MVFLPYDAGRETHPLNVEYSRELLRDLLRDD